MSRTPLHAVVCLAAVLSCLAPPARGGAVQFQLGEQDFADGKTPVYSREIREAGAGEAYPFDGSIFGNDVKPYLGAFDFEHTFDLGGAEPTAARLTMGLIDIDSPAEDPVDTLMLYFDGVAQPTDLFRGISASGAASSVEVVDVPVPLDLLADGVLQVSVVAARPGMGNLGNAIEADFSRLVVTTAIEGSPVNPGPGPGPLPLPPIDPVDPIDPGPSPNPVPLPPGFIPAAILLTGLAASKRGIRRWLGA